MKMTKKGFMILAPLLLQGLMWAADREPPTRDLDSLGRFSGLADITRNMLRLGKTVVAFGKPYDEERDQADFTTAVGFERASTRAYGPQFVSLY